MRVTGNNRIHSYRLSIRTSADGFSLYIYRGDEYKPCECQQVHLSGGEPAHIALQQALTRERIVDLQYDAVEMVLDAPTTRIPLEQFQREDIEMLYRLTFPHIDPKEHHIGYEILPHLEVVEIYAIPAELLHTLQRHCPLVQLHTLQGRIMEDEARSESHTTTPQRSLHVHQLASSLFVFTLSRRRLHLACTYEPQHPSDAAYYVLQLWKRLEFDAHHDTCVLHDCGALADALSRFIQNVKSCE